MPPLGFGPCCAFGQDLETELFRHTYSLFLRLRMLPIAKRLGKHIYNDGSEYMFASLMGLSR
ncbi:DUF4056 domain-containing protein [Photobacterium leiognathi]|uniref:DUF4056 domain-containing protein n=1 Tax=Photobacterium leiognathi TaxID=553611 RepID=UPI0034E96AB0